LRFNFSGIATIHRIDIDLYTGLNQANEMKVRVSPNPSVRDFLVRTPDSHTSIVIYDMMGKVVEQSKDMSYERRIGSDLNSGVYLLVVTDAKGAKQRIKIVKK